MIGTAISRRPGSALVVGAFRSSRTAYGRSDFTGLTRRGSIVNLVNDLPVATLHRPDRRRNAPRPALLRLSRELRREIHSLGVTGGQVSLLIKIQKEPGIGVRELARCERMSTPGMSKYVARLEAAGLLRRTELEDRRRIGLQLTAEGARVLASVKRRRTAWLAARLRGLPPGELEAIDAAVAPLLKLLEVDD